MLWLDHIVHFTEEQPGEIVSKLTAIGFNAVVGGSHEQWGTTNALLYTKDSYIEFLAVEHQDVVQQSDHPLILHLKNDLPNGSGFGTICLRTDNINKLKEQLVADGLQTSEIYKAQRKTASGSVRKWKMLFISEKISEELPTPFFIEWEEEDERRRESLRQDGTIKESNQLLSVESCVFYVKDPIVIAAKWRRYLGLASSDDQGQVIQLPNSKLIFQEGNGKERLHLVNISGYEKSMELDFAGARYSFG